MRKRNLFLAALPALLLSCGRTTTDSANDAGGTGSPFLAREVAGVHILTTDRNYDEPCNYLGEGFIRDAFNVDLDVTLTEYDHPNGCEFKWDNNEVGLFFAGAKPYPSIYHAEYAFDKLYQPRQAAMTTGQPTVTERLPLSGPAPQGTASEFPPVTAEAQARNDSTAAKDTATTTSRVPAKAAHFTEPVTSQGRFVAVPKVGDKAVWDPSQQTLHVLFNNNVLHVQVKVDGNAQMQKERAAILAEVMIDHLMH